MRRGPCEMRDKKFTICQVTITNCNLISCRRRRRSFTKTSIQLNCCVLGMERRAEAIIGSKHMFVIYYISFLLTRYGTQVLWEVWTFALLPRRLLVVVDAQNIAYCNLRYYYLEIIRFVAFLSFFSFFVLNNDVFIVLWCGLRLTESINKAFKHFIHWMGFLLLMQRRMWEKMKLGLAVGIGENCKLFFTGSGDENAHNVMFTH